MSRPYPLLLLLTGQALAAQGSRDSAALANPVMAATRPQYEQVKDYLLRAADQMPEQNYAFRPTPQVRTFGQLLGHIATTQHLLCAAALDERPVTTEEFEKTLTSKTSLVDALLASFSYCDRAYRLTDARATASLHSQGAGNRSALALLVQNIAHDNEHYGNIVTYLRLNNLVPPSSQP